MKSKFPYLLLIVLLLSGCITVERVNEESYKFRKSPNFEGTYYSQQDLDEKVAIIESKDPQLPTNVRDSSLNGWARVELIVDVNGKPTQIQTIRATNSSTALAAERCLSHWVFNPGIIEGKKVQSLISVDLDFDTRMNRLRKLKREEFRDPHKGPPAMVPLY